jgi:hypothetical protein
MPTAMPNLPEEPETEAEEIVVEIPDEDDAPDKAEPEAQQAKPEPRKVEPQRQPEPEAKPETKSDPTVPIDRSKTAAAADDDDEDDASLSEKVRKRINKLTYKHRKAEREAEEFRLRLEAIQRERETEKRSYEDRVGQSDDLIIASREEAIKAEIARANQDYVAAYRSGDEAELIKSQNKLVEMQVAQQELLRVKQRRDAMRQQPQQQQPNQPAAGYSGQQAPDPEFAQATAKAAKLADEYIAQYQEWWDKDEVLTGSVLSIDKRLKAEGMKPWEPEFYEELDKRLRKRFPADFSAPAEPSRPSQPVAGVTRGTPAKGSVAVRLTPEDKAFCERHGLDINAYAREKHALERQS